MKYDKIRERVQDNGNNNKRERRGVGVIIFFLISGKSVEEKNKTPRPTYQTMHGGFVVHLYIKRTNHISFKLGKANASLLCCGRRVCKKTHGHTHT